MHVTGRPAGRFVMVVLAALVMALSACAAPAGTGPSSDSLAFAGPTVDGGTFDASTLAGTPAVLWFWAPF